MARMSKKCKSCGKRKPIRSFYPSSKCRHCTAEVTEKYRQEKKRLG